jgi:hypothetical protein
MITDWISGLAFSLSDGAVDGQLTYLEANTFTAQVRTFYLCKTATTPLQPRADLELMHTTLYICLFLHFRRTASTAWPPAGYIRPPPDARQPRG